MNWKRTEPTWMPVSKEHYMDSALILADKLESLMQSETGIINYDGPEPEIKMLTRYEPVRSAKKVTLDGLNEGERTFKVFWKNGNIKVVFDD